MELGREINAIIDKQSNDEKNQWLDIAQRVLSNSDGKILEEVCCDIIAIYVLSKYFEDDANMSPEEISVSLSSVHYFLLCTHWLSTSEELWKCLYEVTVNIENDDAFVNPQNPYYDYGAKITNEYAVPINFAFSFCNNILGFKFDNSYVPNEFIKNGFVSMLNNARGYDVMDKVLNRTRAAKVDYTHAVFHQKKKNQLIGWENN